MRLTVKNYFFYYLVVDENNSVAAKIINDYSGRPAKKILDSTGQVVYTTDIVNLPVSDETRSGTEARRYVIYKDQQKAAEAAFKYAKNNDANVSRRFVFRSPPIDEMNIQTIYGNLNIKRQRDNNLIISEKETLIGNVSNFFTLKRHTVSCKKIEDKAFLAALYILAKYMMHEDDLIIV